VRLSPLSLFIGLSKEPFNTQHRSSRRLTLSSQMNNGLKPTLQRFKAVAV
jgi:hypothetical protein